MRLSDIEGAFRAPKNDEKRQRKNLRGPGPRLFTPIEQARQGRKEGGRNLRMRQGHENRERNLREKAALF